jgi:hypothetical protein
LLIAPVAAIAQTNSANDSIIADEVGADEVKGFPSSFTAKQSDHGDQPPTQSVLVQPDALANELRQSNSRFRTGEPPIQTAIAHDDDWDDQPIPPSPAAAKRDDSRLNADYRDPMQVLSTQRLDPMGDAAVNRNVGESELPVIDQRDLQEQLGEPPLLPQFDSAIEPATYTDATSSLDLSTAKSMVQTYNLSGVDDPLPGSPLSVVDLLLAAPIPNRVKAINQYWETYFDWAVVINRSEHLRWLNQLPAPRNLADQSLLQVAKREASDLMLAAEIQLARSQSKLAQFATRSDVLPLPSDLPLVSRYKTHYEWYDSRHLIPARLKGVDRILPATLQLIAQRADTIHAIQSAMNQTQSALNSGQTSVATLLQLADTWQSSMEGFTASVVNYNQAIADYVFAVTPIDKPVNEIAAMLVSRPAAIAANSRLSGSSAANRLQDSGLQNSGLGTDPTRLQPARQSTFTPPPTRDAANPPATFQPSGSVLQPRNRSGANLSPGNFQPPSKGRLPTDRDQVQDDGNSFGG